MNYYTIAAGLLLCVIGWFVNLLLWVWIAALAGIAFLGLGAMGQ